MPHDSSTVSRPLIGLWVVNRELNLGLDGCVR